MTVKQSSGRGRRWLQRVRLSSRPAPADPAVGSVDPWLRLSAGAAPGAEAASPERYRRDRQAAAWEAEWRSDVGNPGARAAQTPAWLYESSPYGAADEDGTLREVDSTHWRGIPWRLRQPSRHSRGPVAKSAERGSVWLMQTALAATMLAAAVYGFHSDSAAGDRIRMAVSYAISSDWSQKALPVVERVWNQLRASAASAEAAWSHPHTQPPLAGAITADYSAKHPEMVIQGTAAEPVVSIAAGTVVQVQVSGGSTTVVIDHGSGIGVARYAGLSSVSVKQGEYVNQGEVIGRLPNVGHPVLTFSLTQDGQPVNPHSVVPFPSDSE